MGSLCVYVIVEGFLDSENLRTRSPAKAGAESTAEPPSKASSEKDASNRDYIHNSDTPFG